MKINSKMFLVIFIAACLILPVFSAFATPKKLYTPTYIDSACDYNGKVYACAGDAVICIFDPITFTQTKNVTFSPVVFQLFGFDSNLYVSSPNGLYKLDPTTLLGINNNTNFVPIDIDGYGNYIYSCVVNSSNWWFIYKVDKGNLNVVDSIPIANSRQVNCITIDNDNLYAVIQNGTIFRVDLTTFKINGQAQADTSGGWCGIFCTRSDGTYLYGASSDLETVDRFTLAPFTYDSYRNITSNSGPSYFDALGIYNKNLYVVDDDSPAHLFRIDLTSWTLTNTTTLQEDGLGGLAIDPNTQTLNVFPDDAGYIYQWTLIPSAPTQTTSDSVYSAVAVMADVLAVVGLLYGVSFIGMIQSEGFSPDVFKNVLAYAIAMAVLGFFAYLFSSWGK